MDGPCLDPAHGEFAALCRRLGDVPHDLVLRFAAARRHLDGLGAAFRHALSGFSRVAAVAAFAPGASTPMDWRQGARAAAFQTPERNSEGTYCRMRPAERLGIKADSL